VSLPPYPQPFRPAADAPQPGLYPLRPLTVGEILSTGFQVTRRHLAVLAPMALVVAGLNIAVTLGVLAANGSLHDFATGDYARLPANPTSADVAAIWRPLLKVMLGTAAGLTVSLVGSPFLAGVLTPFAAQAATSRTGDRTGPFTRLRGRWGTLLAASVVAGVLTAAGFVLFVVPGVMLLLILMPLGPVLAMEGLPVKASFRRAAAVSRGFKGRLLGVTLLAALFAAIAALVVGLLFGSAIDTGDPVRRLLLSQGLSLLVSLFTLPWVASVTAMLYIDIRMRREGLAQALQSAARVNPLLR